MKTVKKGDFVDLSRDRKSVERMKNRNDVFHVKVLSSGSWQHCSVLIVVFVRFS